MLFLRVPLVEKELLNLPEHLSLPTPVSVYPFGFLAKKNKTKTTAKTQLKQTRQKLINKNHTHKNTQNKTKHACFFSFQMSVYD